ncbi:MAG: hypothetical protein JXN64_13505 [Spirochaetes bacterium]|nr:hypothetical protein [Spirochaetota bacterium]
MKNTYRFIIIVTLAGFLAAGIYCNISDFNKGSLSLNLSYSTNKHNAGIGTRLPEVNDLIDSYEIFLNGPYGEKASFKTDNEGTIFIDDLLSGEWLLTATAVNVDKIPVGSSNTSVTILSRKNLDYKILLTPYDEIGIIRFSITCDPLLAKDPLEIVIKETIPSINQGGSFKITAMPVENTDVIYSWFIDGVLKESGINNNCLTVPCDLTKGNHRADVAIFTIDGLIGGSAAHVFEVL